MFAKFMDWELLLLGLALLLNVLYRPRFSSKTQLNNFPINAGTCPMYGARLIIAGVSSYHHFIHVGANGCPFPIAA
jgi:hypothetical protein